MGCRNALGGLQGPYAFMFYHSGLQRLYYGRDPLGRRSLVVATMTESTIRYMM